MAVPFFITLVLLEGLVLKLQGKKIPRLNDSLGSVSNGLLSLLHSLLFRSTEFAMYLWVYERYNLVSPPWDSPLTWLLTLLAIDFAYYWVHRCGHEMNIFWAGHQTHHSSEEYNLTTALRQSMFQQYFSWVFYMPLGLFIPPPMFLVHNQFNLIYQFWIHTETIGRLGPLEWFLSTPSHHRVHHGRNPYCIDKNYGGVFIIWDRIFGTFQAEKVEEKPVYGLVHNIKSWNPLYAQLFHLRYLFQTAFKMEGFSNKVSVFLKGPGWSPGKPRLGLPQDIPEVKQNPNKYDRDLPAWNAAYIWIHFLLMMLLWHPSLAMNKENVSTVHMTLNIFYIVFSLTVFGIMYDNSPHADLLEMIRCDLYLLTSCVVTLHLPGNQFVFWFYTASTVLWTLIVIKRRSTVDSDQGITKKLSHDQRKKTK